MSLPVLLRADQVMNWLNLMDCLDTIRIRPLTHSYYQHIRAQAPSHHRLRQPSSAIVNAVELNFQIIKLCSSSKEQIDHLRADILSRLDAQSQSHRQTTGGS